MLPVVARRAVAAELAASLPACMLGMGIAAEPEAELEPTASGELEMPLKAGLGTLGGRTDSPGRLLVDGEVRAAAIFGVILGDLHCLASAAPTIISAS